MPDARRPLPARGRKVLPLLLTALWVGDKVRRALQGPPGPYSYRPGLLTQLYANVCVWIDKRTPWHTLPVPLALVVMIGDRVKLRMGNLHDTGGYPTLPQPEPQARGTEYLQIRMPEGTFNDLHAPTMGAANTRFGRNVPTEFTWPDPEPRILSPNPRVVSRELLTRDSFVPATSLNMLAAAWIQFMTRDWFSHGSGDINTAWQLPLPPGDDFPQNPMLIPRTIADPTRPPDDRSAPPTHVNLETHWWDGSQIYPTNQQLQASVRTGTGGKLRMVSQGGDEQLPPPLLDQLGQVPGWWVGLGLLLTLFAREHNAICGPSAGRVPDLVGPGALRSGPADQCGADGQDPHGRMDARDHRPSGDENCHVHQLVGDPRQRRASDRQPVDRGRDHPRHSG